MGVVVEKYQVPSCPLTGRLGWVGGLEVGVTGASPGPGPPAITPNPYWLNGPSPGRGCKRGPTPERQDLFPGQCLPLAQRVLPKVTSWMPFASLGLFTPLQNDG